MKKILSMIFDFRYLFQILQLFQYFQELDDVYHDSSAVVAETLVQGADIVSLKVRERLSNSFR